MQQNFINLILLHFAR